MVFLNVIVMDKAPENMFFEHNISIKKICKKAYEILKIEKINLKYFYQYFTEMYFTFLERTFYNKQLLKV